MVKYCHLAICAFMELLNVYQVCSYITIMGNVYSETQNLTNSFSSDSTFLAGDIMLQ